MLAMTSNGATRNTISHNTAGPAVTAERSPCPRRDNRWPKWISAARVRLGNESVIEDNQRLLRQTADHRVTDVKSLRPNAHVQGNGAKRVIIGAQPILGLRTTVNEVFDPRRNTVCS